MRFREFILDEGFPDSRIKLSIYVPDKSDPAKIKKNAVNKTQVKPENVKTYRLKKGNKPTFIIYVNSRPLKRRFDSSNPKEIVKSKNDLFSYLGGRFDADGHFDRKKNRLRICYSKKNEAENDISLVNKITSLKPNIKYYKKANEWILECSGKKWKNFNKDILENSLRYD